MKKKISTLLFAGIFAMISMGFRTPSTGNDFSYSSAITIIKGQVYNTDHDKYWEFVTFGVAGMDQDNYEVAFVDIFDRDGGFIARVDDPDTFGDYHHTDWYRIDLHRYDIKRDFTLEIHVVQTGHCYSTCFSSQTILASAIGAPIDPEETILIVKYP